MPALRPEIEEVPQGGKYFIKPQLKRLDNWKSLRGGGKYYLADPGIYFARNVDVHLNHGPSLENVLYVYLRFRGYRFSAGRIGKLECDFIARKHDLYATSRCP